MWVNVPVILVRRKAHAKIRNENGIRMAAKISSAAIEGHSWDHPARASSAARDAHCFACAAKYAAAASICASV